MSRRFLQVVVTGVLAAFIVFLAYSYLIVGARPYWAPKKAQTLSQIRKVAVAVRLYTADHDETFPPDTSSVRVCLPALDPYFKNDWPRVSMNPDSPEFLGNGSLAGKRTTSIKDPGARLMFFDSAPWTAKFRVVAFADTSCRAMQEPVFQLTVANNWQVAKP